MDRYLRPSRFDGDPNTAGSDKQFKHWLKTFQNFVKTVKSANVTATTATAGEEADAAAEDVTDVELITLINYVAANVYDYIADCTSYAEATTTLSRIYVKPINEIYAQYKLATRKQTGGESINTYIQDLHRL